MHKASFLITPLKSSKFKATCLDKGQLTVMTLSFRKDRSGQTVQTQIKLFLEEQSDQGLHYLLLTKYLQVWPLCLNFRCITAKFLASENLGTLRKV